MDPKVREVRLEHLRPAQVIAEREQSSLIYLPVGSLEWHGPHLPLGVDMILAHEVTCRVAQQVGGVVHPAVYCGTERERPADMAESIGFAREDWVLGMDFPANSLPSLYYPEESFALAVREALARLQELGFKRIVIVNGHGATNQIRTLERLAAASTKGDVRVTLIMPFPEVRDETGNLADYAGHADIYETALMMALHPEMVDIETLPAIDHPLRNVDWAVVDAPTFSGSPTPDFTVRPEFDPRYATAAQGEDSLEAMVNWVADKVRAFLA